MLVNRVDMVLRGGNDFSVMGRSPLKKRTEKIICSFSFRKPCLF
ncbi:hypothetical protein [Picosynechococcus sp. PCC 7002]|nr:hypothetical protein [Picosynechococcus sp. PCC 7002]